METTNLSKIRRDKMLNTINEIKKGITDEQTLTNLSMIENELTKKKYGLIWEEHEERVDKELETQIPTFEDVKEKEIIYWSKKHYEKELHQNKKFIEYLESCKEHPDKLKDKQRKSQEFIKTVDVDPKTGEIIHPEKVIVFLDKKLAKYIEKMLNFCLTRRPACDNIFR